MVQLARADMLQGMCRSALPLPFPTFDISSNCNLFSDRMPD